MSNVSLVYQIVHKSLGLTGIRIVKTFVSILQNLWLDSTICMLNGDWSSNLDLYNMLHPGLIQICRIVLCLSYNKNHCVVSFLCAAIFTYCIYISPNLTGLFKAFSSILKVSNCVFVE